MEYVFWNDTHILLANPLPIASPFIQQEIIQRRCPFAAAFEGTLSYYFIFIIWCKGKLLCDASSKCGVEYVSLAFDLSDSARSNLIGGVFMAVLVIELPAGNRIVNLEHPLWKEAHVLMVHVNRPPPPVFYTEVLCSVTFPIQQIFLIHI